MFLEKLAKLIDVKSIVTLALVAILCVMTICGKPTNELFNSAVMLVLGFFFGKNVNSNVTTGDGKVNAQIEVKDTTTNEDK